MKNSLSILKAAAIFTLLLTACETTNVSGSWVNLGTISNGNIKVSVDKNSIRNNGSIVTFRDQKLIHRMKEERFVNTPAYKKAIGNWEFHCKNKTYRLTALQLFDERGQIVSNQSYTAANLRPMSIMNGTITEKQYELVCGSKL